MTPAIRNLLPRITRWRWPQDIDRVAYRNMVLGNPTALGESRGTRARSASLLRMTLVCMETR